MNEQEDGVWVQGGMEKATKVTQLFWCEMANSKDDNGLNHRVSIVVAPKMSQEIANRLNGGEVFI